MIYLILQLLPSSFSVSSGLFLLSCQDCSLLLLLLHGTRKNVVNYDRARTLFYIATGESKSQMVTQTQVTIRSRRGKLRGRIYIMLSLLLTNSIRTHLRAIFLFVLYNTSEKIYKLKLKIDTREMQYARIRRFATMIFNQINYT